MTVQDIFALRKQGNFAGNQLGQLRRERATVPAGSPAVPPAQVPAPMPALSDSPASSALSGSPAEVLSKGQQAVLDCIKANPGYHIPKIEAATGIPYKSIERHISVLIERNLIEHRGSKKTGGYYAR